MHHIALGKLEAKGALADLRASISLMTMSIAKKLPFELKPSITTIELAECSIKLSCGEFEDLSIQLGNIVVLYDFAVLDIAKTLIHPSSWERFSKDLECLTVYLRQLLFGWPRKSYLCFHQVFQRAHGRASLLLQSY